LFLPYRAWLYELAVVVVVATVVFLLVRASGSNNRIYMTMIRKCWTGIREMNKYELTRGGMRSLELLMTLTASYQEIKQKNSERTAETHTKIGSCYDVATGPRCCACDELAASAAARGRNVERTAAPVMTFLHVFEINVLLLQNARPVECSPSDRKKIPKKKYTGGFSWGVWGRRWAKNPVI
jgi:hypothetical protein